MKSSARKRAHLDGLISISNTIIYGAHAQSYTKIDGQPEPVVAFIPVHVHRRSSRQDRTLSPEARLSPLLCSESSKTPNTLETECFRG